MASTSDGKMLFCLPDISGFTKFVAATEISHSQHIVRELLEALIDANCTGLQVSEIEGDAVPFYRLGAPPSLAEMVEQARRMFVAFHTQLKKYELYRVCQCGACASASALTLKVVAHYGAAAAMQVRDHSKFIGTGVIVAHRLLKNSLAQREYLLLSDALIEAQQAAPGELALFSDGADAYDELGTIAYKTHSLTAYLAQVSVAPPLPFTLASPQLVMRISRHIRAPMRAVYRTLIDLPRRMIWIADVKQVQVEGDPPNRIGTRHRCLRNSGGDPELVTSDVLVTETTMELWETDVRKLGTCRYRLRTAAEDSTDMDVEFYVRGNVLVRLVFRLAMQEKVKAGFEASLLNLARLCEAPA